MCGKHLEILYKCFKCVLCSDIYYTHESITDKVNEAESFAINTDIWMDTIFGF